MLLELEIGVLADHSFVMVGWIDDQEERGRERMEVYKPSLLQPPFESSHHILFNSQTGQSVSRSNQAKFKTHLTSTA